MKFEVAGARTRDSVCLAFSLIVAALFVSDSYPPMTVSRVFKVSVSDCVTKDSSVKSEVAGANRDSVCCFLTSDCCAALFVSASHPLMTVFRCLQSFLTDCVTKDASVKSEVVVILCLSYSLHLFV